MPRREADDLKLVRKLADNIERVDPDRTGGTQNGQTFHALSLKR